MGYWKDVIDRTKLELGIVGNNERIEELSLEVRGLFIAINKAVDAIEERNAHVGSGPSAEGAAKAMGILCKKVGRRW